MPHPFHRSSFPIHRSAPLLALLALTTCTPTPPHANPPATAPAPSSHPAPLSDFSLQPSAFSLNLAGDFALRLDPANLGEKENWQSQPLPDHLHLPGSLQEQNFGELPSPSAHWTARIGLSFFKLPQYQPYEKEGHFKAVSWLTPNRVYVGPAWYERNITIPPTWANKHIELSLERPHGQTTLYLDGTKIDSQYSLNTPHTYALPATLTPGQHTLTLREDNSLQIPIGPDASAVTDQTQTNWNGFIGDLSLHAQPQIRIDDVQLFPNLTTHTVHIKANILNDTAAPADLTISAVADLGQPGLHIGPPHEARAKLHLINPSTPVELTVPTSATPWDEFHADLREISVSLLDDSHEGSANDLDSRSITFGMRTISTDATQLTLNNHKLFLRGTLDCCVFPLTGYPPTDLASWKREFSIIKSFGLNHMRFHSWCPPEAAFQAADELGIYLQIEGPVWAAFGSGNALDKWIPGELQRTLKTFGNHPSFCFLSPANEPGSRTDAKNAAFLSALIAQLRKDDPRHLYTAGSNWPNVPTADYQVMSSPRMNGSKELNREPATTADYSAIVKQWKMPIVSHETGQWCVYPNFDEIPKYTGSLHPGNLEIFQDFLNKSGMGAQAHNFLMASGHFQALLYKEEIEALLRTPNIGGFQLLDLHDFPGQGTAPVGVLDCFWDEKGYITAKEFSQFCGPTVPLARLPKRVYTTDETFAATVQVAHYGEADLPETTATWSLKSEAGDLVSEGKFDATPIPAGQLTDLGPLHIPLNTVKAPARLTLSVTAADHTNSWQVWVYPAALPPDPAAIVIASSLDDLTLAALAAGKSVLLLPYTTPPAPATGPASRPAPPAPASPNDTHGNFSPIFWNRITFPGATIHTLSILCDPKNPALAQFPTDPFSNWQWADLQNHSKPLLLSGPTQSLTPIVQIIDDWNTARKLAYITEANVGPGKLLIASLDLSTSLDKRPPARQLRQSLLHYMSTQDFHPTATLTPADIRAWLR